MKIYSKNHIGETYLTNEGYHATIITGGSRKSFCTIQIEEWIAEVQFSKLKDGSVKYPYHKSVYGTGFLGEGEYNRVQNKKIHQTWKGMLERCYDEKCQLKYPTYKGVTVCKEWHNFQTFAEWMEANYIDGYHLDKDILSKIQKIYSPTTCCFIPQTLNTFMSNHRTANTTGYTGVARYKETDKWLASIRISKKRKHLGIFDTKAKAYAAYKIARSEKAEKLKLLYATTLPDEVLAKIA